MPHGGAWQLPIVQTRSRSQLSPRQHEAPSRPQGTHLPLWQTPPESHTSPQHEAPMPPQGGGSSGGTVTSMPGASGAASGAVSRAAVASFAASLGALRSSPVSNQGTSSAVSGLSRTTASPVSS
jgi:hypothetical protein